MKSIVVEESTAPRHWFSRALNGFFQEWVIESILITSVMTAVIDAAVKLYGGPFV